MFVHHTQLSSLAMLREMSAITFHPSLNPSRSMAASAQKTGNPMTNEMKDGNCALSPSLWHGSTRDFRLLRIVSRLSGRRAFQSFPRFNGDRLTRSIFASCRITTIVARFSVCACVAVGWVDVFSLRRKSIAFVQKRLCPHQAGNDLLSCTFASDGKTVCSS